jgi:putative nucleotidyltransferase with HDIG domain
MNERERIAAVLADIKALPTLPDVAVRLLEMERNPNASAGEMAAMVEQDMSLAMRVLKMVNSPYFGLRREITSIQQAVVFIGTSNLRSVVLAGAVSNLFDRRGSVKSFNRMEFWKHSLAVAAMSRELARRTKIVEPQIAFTGGLIHDMGKVVIDRFLHRDFELICDLMDNESMTMSDAEREILGVDHAQIGSHLASRWNLPDILREVVNCHHKPLDADAFPPFAAIVSVADHAVRKMNIGCGGGVDPELSESAHHMCLLDAETIEDLQQTMREPILEQIEQLAHV